MNIHANKQTGFSLIELMVTITIISILTTLSIVSYQHIQNKIHLNHAKQGLLQAAKQYHFYQLANPYLLNDLTHNIAFENNNDYHYQIEETKAITSFVAIKNHAHNNDKCTKLTLNTQDETQAFDFDGQSNDKCW